MKTMKILRVVFFPVFAAAGAAWQLAAVHAGGDAGLFRDQPWHLALAAAILWAFWRTLSATAGTGGSGGSGGTGPDPSAVGRVRTALAPALFAAAILYCWEAVVVGFRVPAVLLPPPSHVAATVAGNLDVLRDDFHQTFVRSVIPGYLIGCGAGLAAGLAARGFPFLGRGLLPLGNFMAAAPIVGVAPVMVMWFGFDWQSKAAVAAIMTFFPMLVNAAAGLGAGDALERDLMRTYAPSPRQAFFKADLPRALPFFFNGFKVNSALALIGAIVAEFFGTPIVGMGFRISSGVGRLDMGMVWATIVVAAAVGSSFYGLLALAERRLTFWHPSFRRR